jgi:hypothetical protein
MTETIDITPQGMLTEEGVKRVNDSLKSFEQATAEVANAATQFFDDHCSTLLELARGTAVGSDDRTEMRESLRQLTALIEARRQKQEAFLRAVAGAPPPGGWSEERVAKVAAHYEGQTEDEAVAEDEAQSPQQPTETPERRME